MDVQVGAQVSVRQGLQLGTEPAVDADRVRSQREAPRVAGVRGVLAGAKCADSQQGRTKGGAHFVQYVPR